MCARKVVSLKQLRRFDCNQVGFSYLIAFFMQNRKYWYLILFAIKSNPWTFFSKIFITEYYCLSNEKLFFTKGKNYSTHRHSRFAFFVAWNSEYCKLGFLTYHGTASGFHSAKSSVSKCKRASFKNFL